MFNSKGHYNNLPSHVTITPRSAKSRHCHQDLRQEADEVVTESK